MTRSDDELDELLRSTLARRADEIDFEPGRWVRPGLDGPAAGPTRAEAWRSRALLAGAGLAGAAAAAVIVIGALDAASTTPSSGPPTQAIPAPTQDTSISSSPTTARVPSTSLTLEPGAPAETSARRPRPTPTVPAPSEPDASGTDAPTTASQTPPSSTRTDAGPTSTAPPVATDTDSTKEPPVFRTSPPVESPPTTWEPPPTTPEVAPSPSSPTAQDPVTPVVTVVASTGGSPVLCGPVHTCPELLVTTQDLPTAVYTLRCTGWGTPAGTPLGELTTTLGPEPTTTATGCYASTALPEVEVVVLDDEGGVVATTGRVDW